MIQKLVFLVEEPSMAEFLSGMLPRVLPPEVTHQIVPHNGKSALEKSIPRKLRGWREEGVKFIIIRDNDGADCIAVKSRIVDVCQDAGRPDTLVRIACQELESWYLGDLAAVGDAYHIQNLSRLQAKRKYRDPDHLSSPSVEIKKLVTNYQKVTGSRLLGPRLSIGGNKSKSFNVFLAGILRIISSN